VGTCMGRGLFSDLTRRGVGGWGWGGGVRLGVMVGVARWWRVMKSDGLGSGDCLMGMCEFTLYESGHLI
jgi:hypothetical protein